MFSFLLLLLLKNQSQEPSNSKDDRILADECLCSVGTYTIGSTYQGSSFRELVRNCYDKDNRASCPAFLKNSELNCWDVSAGKSLFYGFEIDFNVFVVLTKD